MSFGISKCTVCTGGLRFAVGKPVDVTVFLTNMKDDFPIYNKIYAEYFKDNQPCRTTVEISSLPTPIAIELKCVATVD
jgi:2-aminomuconate deaminase